MATMMIAIMLTGLPFLVKYLLKQPMWKNRTEMIIELGLIMIKILLNMMNI